LQIYDFDTEIVLYYTEAYDKILQVEIEDDAIYYLAEKGGMKQLIKLYEMENNIKI
jgi:hypothetical protein